MLKHLQKKKIYKTCHSFSFELPCFLRILVMSCLITALITVDRDNQTFAATRPSAVLLEQLAVCVSRREPVLLVGETGTGKTSTVQYLAKLTGELRKPAKHWLTSGLVLSLLLWLSFWKIENANDTLLPLLLCLLSRTQVTGSEHEPTERHCWPARRVSDGLSTITEWFQATAKSTIKR